MFKKFHFGHHHSRDTEQSSEVSLDRKVSETSASLHPEPDHQWQKPSRASRSSIPGFVFNRKSFLWPGPGNKHDLPNVEISGQLSSQPERHLKPQPVSRLSATMPTMRSSRSSISTRRSRLSHAPENIRYSHSATALRHQTDDPFSVEGLVQQGINFHETGQLEKGTEQFRQAAALDSPIAMFLYGVSLRHGWGCKKSEHLAFRYLQKAAENAVLDLNSLPSTVNASASKGELVVAIYEIGVSFRHGWGCKKSKETAAHFFKIAADMGDPDAQSDLASCYYHGHGVKKDLYLAAKYYRMAAEQGQDTMGNSWIWKSKYDEPKK